MIDQYGYLQRVYTALAQGKLSVISSGSPPSEGVIEIFIQDEDAQSAIELLYNNFV